MSFFQKIQNAIIRFMYGRNGIDQLGRVNFWTVIVLEVASMFLSRFKVVGTVLYFDRDDVRLPAGTCFIADLLGCQVRDADTGRVYGVIKSIDHPGPQDIYTVQAPDGREYLFPGVPAFLKEKNPAQGYILVTPIPGLFDDDVVLDKPGAQEEE